MTTNRFPQPSQLWSRLVRSRSAPHSRARLRVFMSIEAASFFVAAFVHGGVLIKGREHTVIHVGEMFMGILLMVGVIASGVMPRQAREIAFGTQALAFSGPSSAYF